MLWWNVMCKNMQLVIFFDLFLNPSFKMMTSFTNIASTASTEIFTTFEKIHHSFIKNLKSKESKNQIKAALSYLANSYFYN